MNYRLAKGHIVHLLCGAAALAAAGILILILGDIFLKAVPSLTLSFLLTPESASKTFGDSIANAVAGSFILSICATILALPFAVSTAIYLQRYAKDTPLTRGVRFMIEVLSGTPSIVLGIFGLLVFVVYLKPFTGGMSLIACSVALACLILPVIERATEDAIERVPKEYEEGSYALGATKWDTIRGITVPVAFSGLITGAILGFGRAAEESAVVIMTTGYSQWLPEWKIVPNAKFFLGYKIYPLNDLVGTLPVSVYNAYENSNVYPISAAFGAAFILIMIVLAVNLSTKIIVSRSNRKTSGTTTGIMPDFIKPLLSGLTGKQRKSLLVIADPEKDRGTIPASVHSDTKREPDPAEAIWENDNIAQLLTRIKSQNNHDPSEKETSTPPSSDLSMTGRDKPGPSTRMKVKLSGLIAGFRKKPVADAQPEGGSQKPPFPIKKFLRALMPFAVPVALILIVAFLAGIPPLHQILGPASPSLAGLFSTSLTLIVAIAGLIFGLLVAKRGGAFRTKDRKAGVAGVGAGFCLVLIVAFVLSTAGAGLFNTGDKPASSTAPSSSGDRNAQLAALLASEGQNGDGSPTAQVASVATVPPEPVSVPESSPIVNQGVPIRDALSLHEYYQYGDPSHQIRATVYDSKVLPFYFWWWIDYNRFVQAVPAPGNQFLVVFVRLENTGDHSAIIPSADQFNVTYNGESYGHLAFFNTSVLSQWQIDYYGSHPDKFPYQWIRELGQNKRDYSYLMGYNIFGSNLTSNATATTTTTATPTPTPSSSDATGFTENSVTDMDYLNYNLKPGPSQAIDGYLIYEVPDAAVHDLKNTYMYVAFNGRSATRWRLG